MDTATAMELQVSVMHYAEVLNEYELSIPFLCHGRVKVSKLSNPSPDDQCVDVLIKLTAYPGTKNSSERRA